MLNINLSSLNNAELIDTAEQILNKYDTEKATGYDYRTIQGQDLVKLEKATQRAVFEGNITGNPRPKEIHDRIKSILADDFGMRERKSHNNIKSNFEIEKERCGWGRYGNIIR